MINITILFPAWGEVPSLMTIYPYQQVPSSIVKTIQNSWRGSDRTWLYEGGKYFCLHLHGSPSSTEETKSNVSYDSFCRLTQISFNIWVKTIVQYLTNNTDFTLPLVNTHEVTVRYKVFKLLKQFWKETALELRRDNTTTQVTKYYFAPILRRTLRKIKNITITYGLTACIYP